jgi:hypothetical protein
VWPALENLIDPITGGDPESPLRWTCKSTHALSEELFVGKAIPYGVYDLAANEGFVSVGVDHDTPVFA